MNISTIKTQPLAWMKRQEQRTEQKGMDAETRALLRGLQNNVNQSRCSTLGESIFENNRKYAQSLQDARVKNSKTITELKKLKYNFKAISTQILRSKTSTAARSAAGKARAEVVRLKRLRQSGQYNEEELQYAISHAMAMERVAKKKVKHLQEEERVKVKDDAEIAREPSCDTLMDDFEDIDQELETEERSEEFDVSEILELMDISEIQGEMGNLMMSLLEDLDWADAMTDTLSDLMEGYETEMSPEDFKMFKIKHRNKEMRQIVEADAKYLKAVFDKLQAEQAKGSTPGLGVGGISSATSVSSVPIAAVADMANVPTLDAGTVNIMV